MPIFILTVAIATSVLIQFGQKKQKTTKKKKKKKKKTTQKTNKQNKKQTNKKHLHMYVIYGIW